MHTKKDDKYREKKTEHIKWVSLVWQQESEYMYKKTFYQFWYETRWMQKQSYQWKSQFDDKVHTLLVLYVDNKGEWMNDAIDRAHLKRKVFRQKWFCDQYFNEKNI